MLSFNVYVALSGASPATERQNEREKRKYDATTEKETAKSTSQKMKNDLLLKQIADYNLGAT